MQFLPAGYHQHLHFLALGICPPVCSRAAEQPTWWCSEGHCSLQAFINRFASMLADAGGDDRSPVVEEIAAAINECGNWGAAAMTVCGKQNIRQLLCEKLEDVPQETPPMTSLVVSRDATDSVLLCCEEGLGQLPEDSVCAPFGGAIMGGVATSSGGRRASTTSCVQLMRKRKGKRNRKQTLSIWQIACTL